MTKVRVLPDHIQEAIADARRVGAAIEKAQAQIARLADERKRLIFRLNNGGLSTRDIGFLLNISGPRVYQILHPEKEKTRIKTSNDRRRGLIK